MTRKAGGSSEQSPVDEPALRAPSSIEGLREVRLAREPLRLLASPRLLARRRASGRFVVTAPGFGATDISMAPLRGYLRQRGHRARGAGLGRTHGDRRDSTRSSG